MSSRTKQYLSYALVAIWMVVIFLFSAQNSTVSQGQSEFFASYLGTVTGSADESLLSFITRKAAHTFLYLILGVLIYNALRTHTMTRKKAVLLAIVIACGYACFDEMHQLFIHGRSGEVRDVLIDTAAASIGVTGYALIDRVRRLHNTKK